MTAKQTMTRSDAIREIIDTWLQRDREFCGTESEERQSREELKEALTALGIQNDEMPTKDELEDGTRTCFSKSCL